MVWIRIALVTLLLLCATACSSSSEYAVEFSESFLTEAELGQIEGGCTGTGTPPCIAGAFTAAGEAIDEGVVCSAGNVRWMGNETPDGDPLSDDRIAAQVDAGEIFPIVVVNDYECADGSGIMGMKKTINFDPATMEMDSGTWSIDSGTGSAANLTGSGDFVAAEGVDTMTGSVKSG